MSHTQYATKLVNNTIQNQTINKPVPLRSHPIIRPANTEMAVVHILCVSVFTVLITLHCKTGNAQCLHFFLFDS